MATKTITLTGAEIAVNGLDGANAHIRNDGAAVIYASKTASFTAGADGVMSVPAGASASIYGISGAVYLLGNGAATVVSSDYVESPFKSSVTLGSVTEEIARAVSNSNLLINPDFKINQRGKTEYRTLRECTVDRWMLIQAGINVVDDGITVSPTCVFDQRQESPLPLGICTFSAKINGTVASVKVNITGAQTNYYSLPNTSIMVSFFQKSIRVHNSSGSDWVTINNFKLELGSVATPFCPPDPATELAKCQRYYQIRSAGDIDPVDLRPTMATITDIKQRSDGNYEYIAEL